MSYTPRELLDDAEDCLVHEEVNGDKARAEIVHDRTNEVVAVIELERPVLDVAVMAFLAGVRFGRDNP